MQIAEIQYTPAQAAERAADWCLANPGWERICDIPDHESLYKAYAELPAKTRKYWEDIGGETIWSEMGVKPCKVPVGFVSGAGEFYEQIIRVPLGHNCMMVFKTH